MNAVLAVNLYALLLYALVVAVISRTVTQEEIFREVKEYAKDIATDPARGWWKRKLFYPLTCQYCFSHWVAAVLVLVSGYDVTLAESMTLFSFVFSVLVLVGVANLMLVLYELITLKIQHQRRDTVLSELLGREHAIAALHQERQWEAIMKMEEEQNALRATREVEALKQSGASSMGMLARREQLD